MTKNKKLTERLIDDDDYDDDDNNDNNNDDNDSDIVYENVNEVMISYDNGEILITGKPCSFLLEEVNNVERFDAYVEALSIIPKVKTIIDKNNINDDAVVVTIASNGNEGLTASFRISGNTLIK